jgi:hypothetical protein
MICGNIYRASRPPQDNQIAALQADLQKEKDARREERFVSILILLSLRHMGFHAYSGMEWTFSHTCT